MSVAFHYASLRKWCQQEELGRVIQRSVTSSPVEMRTTAVKKPAVKTSCHGCSCREDALVNPCQNSRKPRQTTTPTQSGYLRSHQQVPTAATPTRATISDYVHGWTAVRCRIPTHPYVHGWTTPTLSGYLYAIASIRAWVDGSTLPHPYASIRAWVDDADTERLPPRHRIRPRERLPASHNCPREHISDENFST